MLTNPYDFCVADPISDGTFWSTSAMWLQVSKSTTKLVVTCIWLGSMLVSAPPLLGMNRFVYEVHTLSSIYISTYLPCPGLPLLQLHRLPHAGWRRQHGVLLAAAAAGLGPPKHPHPRLAHHHRHHLQVRGDTNLCTTVLSCIETIVMMLTSAI